MNWLVPQVWSAANWHARQRVSFEGSLIGLLGDGLRT